MGENDSRRETLGVKGRSAGHHEKVHSHRDRSHESESSVKQHPISLGDVS